MSKDTNTVRYGLSNLYWAEYTEGLNGTVGTWEKPNALPGAVSFDPTSQGNKKVFYADNRDYFVFTNSTGETGNLVVAKFPQEMLMHTLGWIKDDNNALIKATNKPQGKFALLFEVQGDKCPIRYVYYCCTGSNPSAGFTTNQEGIEVQAETMEITASNLNFDGIITCGLSIVKDENPEVFNRFFESVLTPVVTNVINPMSIEDNE